MASSLAVNACWFILSVIRRATSGPIATPLPITFGPHPGWARGRQSKLAIHDQSVDIAESRMMEGMRKPTDDRKAILLPGQYSARVTEFGELPPVAQERSVFGIADARTNRSKRYAAFVAVRRADGRSGWVEARQIARIVPLTEDSEAKSEPGLTSSAGTAYRIPSPNP